MTPPQRDGLVKVYSYLHLRATEEASTPQERIMYLCKMDGMQMALHMLGYRVQPGQSCAQRSPIFAWDTNGQPLRCTCPVCRGERRL